MPSPAHRTRKVLKLHRSAERSRLDKQLIAAAYELVIPVVRRSLGKAGPGYPSASPSTAAMDRPQRQVGGTQA